MYSYYSYCSTKYFAKLWIYATYFVLQGNCLGTPSKAQHTVEQRPFTEIMLD